MLCAFFGCARSVRPDPKPGSDVLGEGWASYYGESLRGNRTASGERFNPSALTAAHRTLSFGSCVEVEQISSGRRVRVRVNDRGPYAKKRVIDVSFAAAQALRMVNEGVTRVRLHPCQ